MNMIIKVTSLNKGYYTAIYTGVVPPSLLYILANTKENIGGIAEIFCIVQNFVDGLATAKI